MNTKLNDRVVLRQMREDINNALSSVRSKYGLAKLEAGKCSYNADGMSCKWSIEGEAKGQGGETQAARDFKTYAFMFGLKPEMFGKTFINGRDSWEIIGLMPRRRKFPVLARNTRSGKEMLFTTDTVNPPTIRSVRGFDVGL